MFKINATPSPKSSNGFLSKIRRNMNIKLPHASTSSKNACDVSREVNDLTSPSSSRSSNNSSPASKSQLTPQHCHRRHAALFSKITFGTSDFIEDRYVYSTSPDDSLPRQVLHFNAVESGPYFAIPSSKEAYMQRLDELFSEGGNTSNPAPEKINCCLPVLPTQSPLCSAFQEMFDFQSDSLVQDLPRVLGMVPQIEYEAYVEPTAGDVTDPISDFLSNLSASLRSDPFEFSPSQINWETDTFEGPVAETVDPPTSNTLASQRSFAVIPRLRTTTLSKPILSRQKRVSPRSRAKSSPGKSCHAIKPVEVRFDYSAMLDSLPPTCFALLPENCIGMAL